MPPTRSRAGAGQSGSPARRIDPFTAARVAYVGVVLLATLTELQLGATHATPDLARRLRDALSLAVSGRDLVDGLRNILLFAGWGLVWSLTERAPRFRTTVLAATVTGLLLSTTVEAVQLFSPRRHASVLDVVTNTAGAFAGAVATLLVLRATAAARTARSFVGVPMALIAACYGAAAAVEIVMPGMRQELLAGSHGGPLDRLAFALAAARPAWPAFGDVLIQLLLMAPAGALLVAALAEQRRNYPRALALSGAAAVVLPTLLELARGASGQPIEPGIVPVHAAGVAAGAWLAFRYLPPLTVRLRGRQRPLALLAAYAAVLLLWRWRPFIPTLDPQHLAASFTADHLLPLASLRARMDIFSAAIVAAGFLLHVPVGAILAAWPLRFHGPLAHALPGIWAVAVIEAGQLFIAGRYFDTTDIIIGAAGVLAGWVIVRRAGFRPWGEALPEGRPLHRAFATHPPARPFDPRYPRR